MLKDHAAASSPARRDTPPARGRSVLLLGNYRPSLVIVRALAAEDRPVVMGLGMGEPGSELSRHVREIWHHPHPRLDGGAPFLRALHTLLDRRGDIGALFPVSEEMVVFLARHRAALDDRVAVVSPSPEVVETFTDKTQSLELARSAGIATDPFAIVHGMDALRTAAAEIGYPLTVRPLAPGLRLLDRKAVILQSAEAFETTFGGWPEGHDRLLVQRFATGPRHNQYFAARNGRLVACVETRILRTNAHDDTGLAVLGETVERTPSLLADTARLVGALDYTGVGVTQFIVSPDGRRHCFLELNPRIGGAHAAPEAAGLRLSRLALALADGADPTEDWHGFTYPAGLSYVWTFGDISGLKRSLADRAIGPVAALGRLCRILADAIRADAHLTWSPRDPLPTVAMFVNGLFRIVLPPWGRREAGADRFPANP